MTVSRWIRRHDPCGMHEISEQRQDPTCDDPECAKDEVKQPVHVYMADQHPPGWPPTPRRPVKPLNYSLRDAIAKDRKKTKKKEHAAVTDEDVFGD